MQYNVNMLMSITIFDVAEIVDCYGVHDNVYIR